MIDEIVSKIKSSSCQINSLTLYEGNADYNDVREAYGADNLFVIYEDNNTSVGVVALLSGDEYCGYSINPNVIVYGLTQNQFAALTERINKFLPKNGLCNLIGEVAYDPYNDWPQEEV